MIDELAGKQEDNDRAKQQGKWGDHVPVLGQGSKCAEGQLPSSWNHIVWDIHTEPSWTSTRVLCEFRLGEGWMSSLCLEVGLG